MLQAGYRQKPWFEWNRFDWSEALLEHYFRRANDRDGPVRVLVATDDELAEATSDVDAAPEEVADSLTRTVLAAVGEKDYWRHAAATTTEPTYFAHLVVACRAAVDLSDVDEDSYIDRLAGLIGRKNTRSLHLMATLWVELAAWLARHPKTYRPLVLPDPRGWTRIGHTTRLAFPSRRDQLRLYQVLTEEGLLLESPPIPPVTAAIQRSAGRFSTRFHEEFSSFRAGLDAGVSTDELLATPLWAAVEAVVRLSLDEHGETASQRWTLLGEDSVFDMDLRVATTHPTGLGGRPVRAEPLNPAPWSYELDGPDPVRDILELRVDGAGALSTLASAGVVPLIQAVHQELELASRAEFSEAEIVLVRDDLAPDFIREFGGMRGDLNVPGWGVVRDCAIRFVRPEDVADSALATCWALHESLFPPSIRFVGGIAIEDGYLLQRDHLPVVRADGATSAVAEIDGTVVDLQRVGGYFRLPVQLVDTGKTNRVTVLVEFPRELRSKSALFAPAPTTERFKVPTDTSRWLSEGNGRSMPLQEELNSRALVEPHLVLDADPVVLLGHAVGTTTEQHTDAAWEIHEFGGHFVGRAIGAQVGSLPHAQSQNAGACRRWRQLLHSSSFSDADEHLLSREWIRAKGLPKIESADAFEPFAATPETSAERLGGMVETVSALSNGRSGLTTKRFLELCETVLGVEPPTAWPVLRSWIESGAMCEGVDRRWSSRRLFARQPRLVVFRTQRWFGATLSGLALESTLSFIERTAAEQGLLTLIRRSELGYTPESIALRSESLEAILNVASLAGLEVSSTAADPWSVGSGSDGNARPPMNYEPVGRAITSENWPEISLQRWARRDAPRYWVATVGGRAAWAYHRETALLLGFAMAGTAVMERIGATLVSKGAHVPLGAARMLNLVAPVLSGPTATGEYRYHCPTTPYAAALENAMSEFVAELRAILTE